MPVLALLVAQVAVSGCGSHSTPAADRCSRDAKPARAGERVNWGGVLFDVPVGWYAVSVCFATGAPPPAGYLTNQRPHAQCSRISEGAGRCGPPAEAELQGADQVVSADILLPHQEVLSVTAYVGPSTSTGRVLGMLASARLSA